MDQLIPLCHDAGLVCVPGDMKHVFSLPSGLQGGLYVIRKANNCAFRAIVSNIIFTKWYDPRNPPGNKRRHLTYIFLEIILLVPSISSGNSLSGTF